MIVVVLRLETPPPFNPLPYCPKRSIFVIAQRAFGCKPANTAAVMSRQNSRRLTAVTSWSRPQVANQSAVHTRSPSRGSVTVPVAISKRTPRR